MSNGNFDIKIGMNAKGFNDSMKSINEELSHLEKMVDLSDKAIKQQEKSLDTLGDKLKAETNLYKQMDKTIKIYSKSIDECDKNIDELTKTYNTQLKELNELKSKYEKLTKEQKENTQEGKQLAREIKQQEKALKQTEGAINRYTKQSNTMNHKLQETKAKMNNLERQIETTGREFTDLGGDVDSAIKDLKNYDKIVENINNKEIKPKINLEDTTKNIDKKIGINQINEGMSAIDGIIGDTSRDFIKTSFDTVNTFDAVMSKVSAISGATGADLDKLREKAKQLGATTKFSATEAGEAMSYMAMAGYSQKEILESIEPVMKLAIADGTDLATVSDIVTDAMTGFGLKAKDTQQFVDILATTASKSNTNVNLLGETFKYVAPVCGTLGINAKDTAVAVGLMANAGIKGSQAGTALRSGLSNLIKPSSEVKKAMKQYNVEIQKNKDGSVNLQKTMEHLRDRLGGLSEAEKGAALSAIFGKEGMSAFASIVNASDQDFKALIDNVKNSDGQTQKMADTMSANGKGAMDNFKSAMEGLYITIGEKLLPIITPVIQKVTEMIGSIIAWCEENPKLAQTLGIIIGVLGAVLGIITTLLPVFIMFGALGAGVALTVIGIVVAITAVITVIILLWQNWDAVCQWCSQAWTNLCTWISEKWEGFKTWIGESLSSIANWFSEKFEQAKTWALEKLQALLEWIKSLPSKIWQGIQSIGKFFGDCFNNAKTWAIEKLQSLLNWIKGIPGKVWNAISSIPQKFFDAFTRAKNKALEAIGNLKDKIVNTVTGWIDKINPFSLNADVNTNENVNRRVTTIGSPFSADLVNAISNVVVPSINSNTRDRIGTLDFGNDFYSPISNASMVLAGQAVSNSVVTISENNNKTNEMLLSMLELLLNRDTHTHIHFDGKVNIRSDEDIEKLAQKLEDLRKRKDRKNGLTKITR